MSFLERFRSSLTYPIAAVLVLVTVVPMVSVGLLLAAYNKERLTDTEKKYLNSQAASLASEVALFFSKHKLLLESTAGTLAAGNTLDLRASQGLLEEMASRDKSLALLWIVDTQGEAAVVQAKDLTADNATLLISLLRNTHEEASKGQTVTNLNVPLPSDDAIVAIYGYPLLNRKNQLWGTLEGAVDLLSLQNRIGDNTYSGLIVSIIDQQGLVVLSSDPSLNGVSFAASNLVEEFLKFPQRVTKLYTHPVSSSTAEVLGSVAPVDDVGWGVVVERPVADAFISVRVMQQRTMSPF